MVPELQPTNSKDQWRGPKYLISATAGANGTPYVNIHIEQNPNGEIRGQGGNPTSE